MNEVDVKRITADVEAEAQRLLREGGYALRVDNGFPPDFVCRHACALQTAAENLLGPEWDWEVVESLGGPPRLFLTRYRPNRADEWPPHE